MLGELSLSLSRLRGGLKSHAHPKPSDSAPLLHYLSLKETQVGRGVPSISEALATNTALRALDLSKCGVSQAGVQALGNALAQNSHLVSLHLGASSLDTDALVAILDGIAMNPESALELLGLRRNRLDDVSAQVLLDRLEGNRTALRALSKIDLTDNVNISNAMCGELRQAAGMEALCNVRD